MCYTEKVPILVVEALFEEVNWYFVEFDIGKGLGVFI